MRTRPLFRLIILLSAVAGPAAAWADTFTFTPSNGNPSITFSIADSTTPTYYESEAYAAYYPTAANGDMLGVTFYNVNPPFSYPYDFQIDDNTSILEYLFDGPALYTGDESSPVFLPGTYNLTADERNSSIGSVVTGATLAITSPVPEPSSLGLLATGLFGAFSTARRRCRKA